MSLVCHLYLTGFRGTGKTSVGKVLAESLSTSLIDLDQQIEVQAGTTIREIFAEGGEARFRELEASALEWVSGQPPAIISLGGGAILRDANRQRIAATGRCVWLDADAETLATRIDQDSTTAERRPALTTLQQSAEIQHLLQQRCPLYTAASDHRVDTTGKSIDEVAKEILQWWSRPQ